jgi:hypothetical protein
MIQPDRICIVHTGLHKTGTSALQAFLHGNQQILQDFGILYPRTARYYLKNPQTQHHMLLRAIYGDAENRYGDRPVQELRAEIEATPHRCLLLSAEWASTKILVHKDTRLLPFLQDLGYHVLLLTYVRPQHEIMVSKYVQGIKSFGRCMSFGEFFSTTLGTPQIDYGRMLDVVLASRVEGQFRPYNAALRRTGIEAAFAAELGDLAGLDHVAAADLHKALMQTPPQRVNESIGPVELAICRAITREVNPDGTLPQRISTSLFRSLHRILVRRGLVETERYQALDAQMLKDVEEVHGAANKRFAQAVWGRSWADMFPGAEDLRPQNDLDLTAGPDRQVQFEKLLRISRRTIRSRIARRQKMIRAEEAAKRKAARKAERKAQGKATILDRLGF